MDVANSCSTTQSNNSTYSSIPANRYSDAINLLISCNLPQFCKKFEEEEVCTNALKKLNENDINVLIPKVGPRAIFRAELTKWKQQHGTSHVLNETQLEDNVINANNCTNPTNGDVYRPVLAMPQPMTTVPPMTIKFEVDNHDTNVEEQLSHTVESYTDVEDVEIDEQLTDLESIYSEQTKCKRQAKDIAIGDAKKSIRERSIYRKKIELDVRDILRKHVEGRKALLFYDTHNFLDSNNRRRTVKVVISIAIERRLKITPEFFHNVTQQFIELFPKESYDTYYIPRKGTTCPRGVLYNKYLNMSRRLRRDGLMDYKSPGRLHKSDLT